MLKTQQDVNEITEASFKIYPEKLEAMGRSLNVLLLHRRCATCWATLLNEPAQGMLIEVEDHMKQIAKQCSKTLDFIQPEMGVVEAVFRILLSHGNKPMTLESIHEEMRERWASPINPRTPPPDKLYRMLVSDAFYGIGQVPASDKA